MVFNEAFMEKKKHWEAVNVTLPCEICGKRHRLRTQKLCSVCSQRIRTHGHHAARAIMRSEMLSEMETAGKLIAKNVDHPALVAWQGLFSNWVEQAKAAPAVTPGGKWVAEFQDGSAAMKVLTIALAHYLRFHVTRDFRMPDVRSLYYHMANRCVFFYHSRTSIARQAVGIGERRAVALWLQKNIGGLLAAFLEAYNSQAKAREELMRMLEEKPLAF
jgi:hypothetical protein